MGTPGNNEWGIRTFLNPVIARLLIYQINPIDVEDVLKQLENVKLLHSKVLEETWVALWEEKANWYKKIAEEAEEAGNIITAKRMYMHTAQCYYAIFLINLSDMNDKKMMYIKYSDFYRKATSLFKTPVNYIEIPFKDGKKIPAYLHLPSNEGPHPCAIVLSGLGSCKEEMNMLARPFVDRGIAALVPDLPGCGETVFIHDIPCRMKTNKEVFKVVADYAIESDLLDSNKIGTCGLCMGGGYAYKMAAIDERMNFCVTLFPLFISDVDPDNIPRWMKQGGWYEYSTGNADVNEFIAEMGLEEDEYVRCSYLLIHGKFDNWMRLENAKPLYDNAKGEKEIIILEQEAVYASGFDTTHTMPVGEQLHWVKHVFADWVKDYVK